MSPEEVILLYAQAPDGPLLAGLSDINWAVDQHAYGKATEVPALLRALVSPDAEHREAACRRWFEAVNHQGSVYPATLRALPFLVVLLDHPQTPDRNLIALLLANMLAARERSAFRPMINPFTQQRTEKPLDFDERRAAENTLVGRIRQVGASAVPNLLPYLRHPDSCLRIDVARALANYSDLAPRIVPRLREALAAETNEDVRESLSESLERLNASSD
jgi:hypothetical protein